MDTKKLLTIAGVIVGGIVIYNMIQGNKKRNKLEVDVKDQISNLANQLQQTKNTITSVAIKTDPALQKTMQNLQNFRGFGINRF